MQATRGRPVPDARSSPGLRAMARLRGLLLRSDLLGLALRQSGGVADRDLARLHFFGQLALELDGQEAVLQLGPRHLHVVGELEAALEPAGGDAAIEVVLLLLAGLLAGDDQQVRLLG